MEQFISCGDYGLKKILVVVAPLALAACGGPVELTVAKLAGDLISYVTTGKSTTDHAVSAVAERDCALHRPLFEEDVCRDNVVLDDAVALAEPGAPSVKQKIRDAEPAIYAVNAPGEDWSQPNAGARTSAVIVQTDLPPRPASHDEVAAVPASAPVEIASAQAQFTPIMTVPRFATKAPLIRRAKPMPRLPDMSPRQSRSHLLSKPKPPP